MKTISQIKPIFILLTPLITVACSNNSDDGDNDNTTPPGQSYIVYSVAGSAVNGNFRIETSDQSNDTNMTIAAGLYNEDTDEGMVRVSSLIFSSSISGENYRDVRMVLPSHTGPLALGEIITSSTGMPTHTPTFHMTLSFDEEAVYDNDGDGDNDLITNLLSKNMSVTITEFEETTNSLGLVILGHIKGSFEGQAYFKANTGPTSDPELVLHSVTGEFEYNIPVN